MGRAVGINLGTTNSCVAVVGEGGRARILSWPDGSKTIPSVFAIDKTGNRLVGAEAKAQAAANPDNTVTAAKRLIGRSFDSDAVSQMSQVFTYELLEGEDSEVLVKVSGQVLTLEQISAAILLRLKEHAESVLGEDVDAAVITVPAYFVERQRQAVRAAGQLAGLEVLRVLNEPTAAALAYGLGRQLNQRVAIYDLGGGTFDISIIDIKDKVFEVIATGGDTFLGGVDFDDRVMQRVLKQFYVDHDVDLSYDRTAVTRVREACELAKIRLSSEDSTVIVLPAIATAESGAPIDLSHPLTRAELEELTGDLVERSIVACQRNFEAAKTRPEEIDELLLVGGQSRMPLVRQRIEAYLGRPPSDKVNPDEAVAIGAAVMAHSLGARRRAAPDAPPSDADVTLQDVLPVPIGLARPDGKLHVLFPRNAPLPARKTRLLTTSKENQRSLVLRMYQGDGDRVEQCEGLGTFVFHGLRKGPKGMVRLEVDFHIDSQGMLNLTAHDKDTGERVASRLRLDTGVETGGGDDEPAEGGGLDMPMTPTARDGAEPVVELGIDDLIPLSAPALGAPLGAPELTDDVRREPTSHADLTADGTRDSGASLDAVREDRRRRRREEREARERAEEEAKTPKVNPELPPPDIENLRSQVRRVDAAPDEKKAQGGFLGWLMRLFGRG